MKPLALIVLWTALVSIAVAPIYWNHLDFQALVVWLGGLALYTLAK
jgi:hypothetical protein